MSFARQLFSKVAIAAWLGDAIVGFLMVAGQRFGGITPQWQQWLVFGSSVVVAVGAFRAGLLLRERVQKAYFDILLTAGIILAAWLVISSVGAGASYYLVYPLALFVLLIGVTNPNAKSWEDE